MTCVGSERTRRRASPSIAQIISLVGSNGTFRGEHHPTRGENHPQNRLLQKVCFRLHNIVYAHPQHPKIQPKYRTPHTRESSKRYLTCNNRQGLYETTEQIVTSKAQQPLHS